MRARVQIPLTPPKNTTTHPVVVFFNEWVGFERPAQQSWAKSVRWTLFRPWENPCMAGCSPLAVDGHAFLWNRHLFLSYISQPSGCGVFNEEWDLKDRPRECENPSLHTQYKKYAKNEYFLIFVLTFCQKHGILQQVERNIVNR